MKKFIVSAVLVFFLVLTIASPSLARVGVRIPVFTGMDHGFHPSGHMSHSAEYETDGLIDFKKQAGHFCNTGAEMHQVIGGEGIVSKTMDVHMIGGKLTVDDANELITAPDAAANLEVTSVIRLCAPPKSVFTEEGALYASLVALMTEQIFDHLEGGFYPRVRVNRDDDSLDRWLESWLAGFPKYLNQQPSPPLWGYLDDYIKGFERRKPVGFLGVNGSPYSQTTFEEVMLSIMAEIGAYTLIDAYYELYGIKLDEEALFKKLERVISGESDITDPLTRQIWAAGVSANPGHTAILNQDFEAAYGPWGGISVPLGDLFRRPPPNGIQRDNGFYEIPEEIYLFGNPRDDTFWFDLAGYPDIAVKSGPDYVGNYFNIDQYAYTSQGVARRYIDISSPWGHGYLHEDMTVTGRTEISESFNMENLPAGSDITTDWWTIF